MLAFGKPEDVHSLSRYPSHLTTYGLPSCRLSFSHHSGKFGCRERMGGYRNATGRKRESPGAVRARTVQRTRLPRGRGEGKSQALSLRTRPEDSPREIHFYLGSWQLCLFFYSEGEQTSFLLPPNATEAACASACRSLTLQPKHDPLTRAVLQKLQQSPAQTFSIHLEKPF